MDTIVALATARGRAGVAIVRVSGERAWNVCERVARRLPEVRKAHLFALYDASGGLIDRGLVVIFDEGRSFTGEKICEFQVHGSVAVVSAMLQACLAVEGVRTAEPGEFTRRAFLAGRMNLTEVEALADLIEAETEGQREQAMRVLDGSAGRLIDQWREDLLQSLAMLEAALDFADEELPVDLTSLVCVPAQRVLDSINREIKGRSASEAIRDGFEVAIIGAVNAGKSTLLNALAGRDAAITSERAGTTRDVIEVRMDIRGLAVTLIDTAGRRITDDELERLGIDRGVERAQKADLRIYLKSNPADEDADVRADDIVVLSKSDLWRQPGVCAITGDGIPELMARIEERLVNRTRAASIFIRERHFDKLKRAALSIEIALDRFDNGAGAWDMVSADIREAVHCMDGIIGRVDTEDILGRIFSSFCVGK